MGAGGGEEDSRREVDTEARDWEWYRGGLMLPMRQAGC